MNHILYPASQIPIDILLSVVDNYGDMGFALELVLTFEQQFPGQYAYHIWTDSPLVVSDFFASNKHILPQYSIQNIGDFGKEAVASVTLALFHIPIPESSSYSPKLIFRIDYLSLDPDWVRFHGSEHINSTETLPIIEIIPSPLTVGGGMIPMIPQKYSRADLVKRFDLDLNKRWVTIFAYADTLTHAMIFDNIPDDVSILLFAKPIDSETSEAYPPTSPSASSGQALRRGASETSENNPDKSIVHIPWVDILTFHDILRESDWSMVRGEVSFANALVLGKPFFWDMYKERGGYPCEQSEQFLDTISDTKYHDLHMRLNRQVE